MLHTDQVVCNVSTYSTSNGVVLVTEWNGLERERWLSGSGSSTRIYPFLTWKIWTQYVVWLSLFYIIVVTSAMPLAIIGYTNTQYEVGLNLIEERTNLCIAVCVCASCVFEVDCNMCVAVCLCMHLYVWNIVHGNHTERQMVKSWNYLIPIYIQHSTEFVAVTERQFQKGFRITVQSHARNGVEWSMRLLDGRHSFEGFLYTYRTDTRHILGQLTKNAFTFQHEHIQNPHKIWKGSVNIGQWAAQPVWRWCWCENSKITLIEVKLFILQIVWPHIWHWYSWAVWGICILTVASEFE